MDIRLDVDRLDHAAVLDKPVDAVRGVATAAIPEGPLRDTLNGVWLGHPLHPLLTDIPIGFWTGSFVLDFLGGRRGRAASDRLLLLGILSAVPTTAAGLADWIDLDRTEQRTGVVHAAANAVGVVLYAASYIARKRGRRLRGVGLSIAGATAMSVGGYLGGHLVYRRGAGVSRNAFDHVPDDWTPVLSDADLPEGELRQAKLGDIEVVLYRRGGAVYALADVCSHVGGPLHEGDVRDPAGTPCVVCP